MASKRDFEHRFEGPVGALSYVVDTDLVNGALHVVPGSHRMGTLRHVDTFSHLGLDPEEWPWERSVPICGQAGDTILFAKYSGTEIKLDGEEHLILREDDILGVIE